MPLLDGGFVPPCPCVKEAVVSNHPRVVKGASAMRNPFLVFIGVVISAAALIAIAVFRTYPSANPVTHNPLTHEDRQRNEQRDEESRARLSTAVWLSMQSPTPIPPTPDSFLPSYVPRSEAAKSRYGTPKFVPRTIPANRFDEVLAQMEELGAKGDALIMGCPSRVNFEQTRGLGYKCRSWESEEWYEEAKEWCRRWGSYWSESAENYYGNSVLCGTIPHGVYMLYRLPDNDYWSGVIDQGTLDFTQKGSR